MLSARSLCRPSISALAVSAALSLGVSTSLAQSAGQLPSKAPGQSLAQAVHPDVKSATVGVTGSGPDLLADFKTTMGEVHCRLFHDKAPLTVANFAGLATGNKPFTDPSTGASTKRPFYDGLTFHRVIPEFMIQGGDPSGNGTGGPGFQIKDEFGAGLRHDRGGLLSMANAGPDTGGSQFFLTEKATPWLNNKHALFGECREVDRVKQMARVPVGPMNRPMEGIKIEKLTLTWGKY